MALNVTFDGFTSLNDGTMSNLNVQYQAYFYKVNAGSSSSKWNDVRTVENTGYFNLNLGDGDFLTQTGNAASGDKVIIVFWRGGARMGTDCSVLAEWGAFEITLDGSSTYTNPTQVKTNLLPNLIWSFPSDGLAGVTYSSTNTSNDIHYWDWSGTNMGHYFIWNSEPIYFINYVRLTHYDWADGFQDNNLPLASTGSHSWSAAGDYLIEIVIEDHCGGTVTGTQNIRIKYPPPVPNIDCNQDVANHIQTPDTVVTFDYNGSNPYIRIYNIDWVIYDDTNTTTSGVVSDIIHHTEGTGTSWYGDTASPGAFTDPGTHNVAIVVYWNDGFDNKTVVYDENFYQDLFTGPTVDFNQVPNPVAVTSGVEFNNLTSDPDSRVGTGFTPVPGAEYYWTWNDEGAIHTADDVDHSYVYSNTPVSDDVTVELCANWHDGWDDKVTCELKNLAIDTTIAVVLVDCYYELTVFGTSDDGTTSGYSWEISRSTSSGVGGPWELLWSSPQGMDQKEKTVCFSENNYFKIEGFVYGTGATTSDAGIIYVTDICGYDCALIIWNGTGEHDDGGDWNHTGHGFEAEYAKYEGTNGLDATNFTKNKVIRFQDSNENNVDNYDLLSMYINIKEWQADKHVKAYFEDGTSVYIDQYIDQYSLNEWQRVVIPLEDFGLTDPISLKRLNLESTGNIGFYLDNVEFVVGAVAAGIIPIQKPELEADYVNKPVLRAFAPPTNL